MVGLPDPRLLQLFDQVIDLIERHPSYSRNVSQAVVERRRLILNYHTHGGESGYCVSVCVRESTLPLLEQHAGLKELAHIRNIARRAEDCEPAMAAFAARLVFHYRLAEEPLIYFDGAPFDGKAVNPDE